MSVHKYEAGWHLYGEEDDPQMMVLVDGFNSGIAPLEREVSARWDRDQDDARWLPVHTALHVASNTYDDGTHTFEASTGDDQPVVFFIRPAFKYAGTLSHATLRPEDLIPTFLDALRVLDPSSAAQVDAGDNPNDERILAALPGPIPTNLLPDATELVTWITERLESCAPAGYHFGTTEGDGSDFGFWLNGFDE